VRFFCHPTTNVWAVTMPFQGENPSGGMGNEVQVLEFSRELFSRIPRGLAPVWNPTWAPDSRRIVVAVNRPRKSDLMEVDVVTSRARLLYSDD
jgi:hypothetical protein